MRIVLDIQENSLPSFLELIKPIGYIKFVNEIDRGGTAKFVADLAEAFNDVKLYEQGKKELKDAKELLNEL